MAAPPEATAFVAREYPRLVGALDLVLGGEIQVAEELAQEALLRATSRWERVSRLESPGGWTHRVALNLARSHLRRRGAERRARARLGPAPATRQDPDAAGAVAVREALAALPQRDRTILVLRYYLELSSSEVAEQLGMTPAAVRKATSRAVAVLRDDLGVCLADEGASRA